MLNKVLNQYLVDLDIRVKRLIDDSITSIGWYKTFMRDYRAIDCTRVMNSGQRIIQTIDYPYYEYISRLNYILESIPEEEDAEGYIAMINTQHSINLEYEATNPPKIYDKKKGLVKPKAAKAKKEKTESVKTKKLALKAAKLSKLKFNISGVKAES